jgi:hypothetical protein
MKTIKFFTIFLLVVVAAGLVSQPALAQTPAPAEYRLNLNRDFGFGAGADIRGLFTLRVIEPEGIQSVTYYIDDVKMATVLESPYKFQFNTNQYDFGWHDLTAEVTTLSGELLTTPARHMNFVSSAVESEMTKKIVTPLIGLVLGIVVLIGAVQFMVMRKRNPNGVAPGTQRSYGYFGGTICSKCGRPTPRHAWGFNIAIGKFDRCENCGRWSVMRAMPYEMLRAAEEAEKAAANEKPHVAEKSEDEKLRDLLEKSKYE